MIEGILKIVKYNSRDSWSVLSAYTSHEYTILEKDVELRAHYVVDITDPTPSVERTFSIVQNHKDSPDLYSCESILWHGDTLESDTLFGFNSTDFESKETKGRIEGIKVMNICHFVPVRVYIVYDYCPDDYSDDEYVSTPSSM